MKRFVQIDDNPEQTDIYLKKLEQMARYGDLRTCRRKYLLNYFDEATNDYCGNCDVCLTRLESFDGTLFAQKALSAVARLQERFGTGYVIDFLRGSQAAKIAEHHKQLKTFGTGADTSKEEWTEIIRELIDKNYLYKSEGQYPLLKLTEKSEEVLKGEGTVRLTKFKERIEAKEKSATYDTDLFRHLKETRKQLAAEENVPAYIVLSDATLQELAMYFPHNLQELSKISGFGEVKMEKYGHAFLTIVTSYCQEHTLSSRIHLKAPKRIRTERLERDTDTKQQTLDLFQRGHSIQKIAEIRKLSPVTIEVHLSFYIQQGTLSIDQLMDREKIKIVQQAIKHVGGKVLTPIKAHLGDDYSFGEIRMVMAYLDLDSPTHREGHIREEAEEYLIEQTAG
jgi:ATP-dependent DNA helicase RecQ